MANNNRKVQKAIRDIRKLFTSTKLSRELGEMAKDIIFKRVKRGFGVDDDTEDSPDQIPLLILSPKYIRQRQRRGVSGSFATARKSNLTDTGQMLDSIEVSSGPGHFRLIIPATERRKRGNEENVPTNAEVAEFVREDRPFFAMTDDEVNILRKEVNDQMRRIIRRIT